MYWPQMNDNIVENWLRSLGLAHYTQEFLDNGYDDLEMCKQIGQEDLDAIGVTNEGHREDILDAVSLLLKYGGTRVYFILDPDYQKFKNTKPNNYASYEVIDTSAFSQDGINHAFQKRVSMFEHVSLMDSSDCMYSQSLNGRAKSGFVFPDSPPLLPPTRSNPFGIPHGSPRISHPHKHPGTSLVTFPSLQLVAVIQGKLSEDGIDLAGYGYCERVSERIMRSN